MRIAIISLILTLALAQGVLAADSIFFDPKAPVGAGDVVKALIQQPNGITALGDISVTGTVSDDLFAYWAGTFQNNRYYYDEYTTYWRPGPIRYSHSTLNFQGDIVEGWTRKFGSYLDYNNFFGSDGVYYKRIIIKRNRNRNTNKRRQIMYSYFINTQTLERSDSGSPPYIVIGGGDGEFVKAQMANKESVFRQILDANPAFPKWKSEAFVTPKSVVVHNGAPAVADDSLLHLIENEIGPLNVK
ncbi:MAG: hypothetical protein M3R04_08345 [bacterium]|nr:hypothetical protein [bacterium]